MQTDSNLCPECGARSSPNRQLCPACSAPVVLEAKGSIEIWRLGEIRPAVLNGMVRTVAKALGLPVIVQPSFLDPRPSQREEWNGISATAFLNQIDRRSQRGSAFSVGITEENIVPGAAWNYLFGYAYLGRRIRKPVYCWSCPGGCRGAFHNSSHFRNNSSSALWS